MSCHVTAPYHLIFRQIHLSVRSSSTSEQQTVTIIDVRHEVSRSCVRLHYYYFFLPSLT